MWLWFHWCPDETNWKMVKICTLKSIIAYSLTDIKHAIFPTLCKNYFHCTWEELMIKCLSLTGPNLSTHYLSVHITLISLHYWQNIWSFSKQKHSNEILIFQRPKLFIEPAGELPFSTELWCWRFMLSGLDQILKPYKTINITPQGQHWWNLLK